jgi:Protein of unknown function (DUF2934)
MIDKTRSRAAAPKATAKLATTPSRTASRRSAPKRTAQELYRRIQHRAYELWEREGRPHGRDQAHWYQAELEITRAGTRAAA